MSTAAPKTAAERRIAASLKQLSRGTGSVVAAPWPDGPVTELLVWIPFLRAVVMRGAVSREDLVAVVRPGTEQWYEGVAGHSTVAPPGGRSLPADDVVALLGEIREDRAPVRALSSRLAYAAEHDSGSGYAGSWGVDAVRALTLGLPTAATVTAAEATSVEVDLAFRAARELGTSFGLVATAAVPEAEAFLRSSAD